MSRRMRCTIIILIALALIIIHEMGRLEHCTSNYTESNFIWCMIRFII